MKNVEKNVEIPSLIDEPTVASLIGVSYTKLRKVLRPSGRISYLRIGASVKYTLADVNDYLAKCRVEAKN
jgi:hypothetical protein